MSDYDSIYKFYWDFIESNAVCGLLSDLYSLFNRLVVFGLSNKIFYLFFLPICYDLGTVDSID